MLTQKPLNESITFHVVGDALIFIAPKMSRLRTILKEPTWILFSTATLT